MDPSNSVCNDWDDFSTILVNGMSWWSASKIKILEDQFDNHVDNCDQCQDNLAKPPPDDDSDYYCPIGESLQETWAEADMEFSWQHDFDGYGSREPQQYTETCPCDKCFLRTWPKL
jgi:hypothetical protein